MAAELEKPLLEFVGGLPTGASFPEFDALDRVGWLDLNLGILRRVVDPILETGRVPNSLHRRGREGGLDHYVAFLLAFSAAASLGQYDPQLIGAEPMGGEGLYLVETNVEDWGRSGRPARRRTCGAG